MQKLQRAKKRTEDAIRSRIIKKTNNNRWNAVEQHSPNKKQKYIKNQITIVGMLLNSIPTKKYK